MNDIKKNAVLAILGIFIVVLGAYFLYSPNGTNGSIACTEEMKQAEACTLEYNPVCGDNLVTYSNPCFACSSGEIDSYVMGECEVPQNAHFCTEEEKQAEVCTMEYNPVCGSNGVTYGNGCEACVAGVDYYVPGEC